MSAATRPIFASFAIILLAAAVVPGQAPRGPQGESLRRAQQLLREQKFDEALAAYQEELKSSPNSVSALRGAATVLDHMGRGKEARADFQKVLDGAATPRAKADAHRDIANSYGFEGDCANAGKYEQLVIDYWETRETEEPGNAYYQQGEMANEAARYCIDAGNLDGAEKWYRTGHDLGLKEPNISVGRKDLWEFRTEHALARLAARRGRKADAQKHVEAAKAALDRIQAADAGLYQQQSGFWPYLTGYVALYTGDYQRAMDDLQKASQNDAFIQCLIGMTYERLKQPEKAREAYRRAASLAGAHNPPSGAARRITREKVG
jgi:tetratricopeptide (TPR) repeat protein